MMSVGSSNQIIYPVVPQGIVAYFEKHNVNQYSTKDCLESNRDRRSQSHTHEDEYADIETDPAYKIHETRTNSLSTTSSYKNKSTRYSYTSLNKVVVYSTAPREKIVRIIPHFERLLHHSQMLLPRYLYRVVHHYSAGKVFEIGGRTHFLSEFAKVNERDRISDLSIYDYPTLRQHLSFHLNHRVRVNGQPFESHFISTTDSFEHALVRANRLNKKNVKGISIYAIETLHIDRPALLLNMSHAMKAWDLRPQMPDWKCKKLLHGAETEWIFLDQFVSKNAVKIEFQKLLHSSFRSESLDLLDIIPNFEEWKNRSVVHRRIYHTKSEKRQLKIFEEKVRIKKLAPLPVVPRSVKMDKRAKFDHHAANRIWNLLKSLKPCFRCEMFMFIASMTMKTTYVRDTIISEVSRHWDKIIASNLKVVQSSDPMSKQEMLVYYRPALGTNCRQDIDEHHDLVEDTIRAWVQDVQPKDTSGLKDLPVYIVRGVSRLPQNLLSLAQFGWCGRCKIEKDLAAQTDMTSKENTFYSSYAEVLKRGERIERELSDQEFYDDYLARYGGRPQ